MRLPAGSISALRDTLEKSWVGQLQRLKDVDTALVLWSIQPLAQGPVRAARAMGMKVLQSGASQRGPSSIQPQAPGPRPHTHTLDATPGLTRLDRWLFCVFPPLQQFSPSLPAWTPYRGNLGERRPSMCHRYNLGRDTPSLDTRTLKCSFLFLVRDSSVRKKLPSIHPYLSE